MKTKECFIKLTSIICVLLLCLSCSDTSLKEQDTIEQVSIEEESVDSFKDISDFEGFFHNKALEIFYRDEMDATLRQLVNESSVTRSTYARANAFILRNEKISIDLLQMLGEKIVKDYEDYFSENDLNAFVQTFEEIYPSLISTAIENPELNTPEVFLVYCRNNNLISETLFNYFSESLKSEVMGTKSLKNLSSEEQNIINIVETVYIYSADFWNQYNPEVNVTRLKGSTVRGAVYDAIGTGIGVAISGGTASFLLGTLFSAMQNEYGEHTRQPGEWGGGGGSW